MMDRRRTQICAKCKSNCAIFNHFTCKYGLIILLEYVAPEDVHIKYIRRRQAETTACEAELSSTSQVSRRSMPGIGYDSAINVHICRNGVAVSVVSENQTFH